MDYKTFVDAYAHNRRTTEHLINLIKTRVDSNSIFSLFLGAGASVTSGVKSASNMIEDWKKKLYASESNTIPFVEWQEKQDWYNAEDEYSRLFELVYDQPAQRRAYVENAVNKSKPGWGYAYLVSLIKKGYFNVIFTTNFDDLINEACYIYSNDLRPMVCAHDSAVSSVRLTSERPKVIKLHGDFLYDSIKNTSTELQSLENNMRDKFVEFARELGLIVIGYAGNDQSVMDLLDVLVRSSNYFRNGIYWCILKNSLPCKRLRQLLRNERVFWVEIDGFDEFVSELANSVRVDLPPGVTEPHLTAFHRTKHLVEQKITVSSPNLFEDFNKTKELYKKVEEALEKVGLFSQDVLKQNKDSAFGMLKTELIPILEAIELIRNKNYKDAVKTLKELIKKPERYMGDKVWRMLIECLLKVNENHEEVRALLSLPPVDKWISSNHYLARSYYCLYICDSEAALSFANRALELNRGLTPAIVNKAMANFIKGDEKEFDICIKELNKEINFEHHRAAAKALEGDINSTLCLLQRSFVLGRYSAEEACDDVVFRVYWEVPEFTKAISHFLSNKSPEFPYLKTCPPSEKELELRMKLLNVR